MSISALPSHILFDIILGVVAGYIDTAITSPPAPRWMHRFSKSAIILVRDFLATQVKEGLREPPHVPIGSNRTEWSEVTEPEFLSILRELVGEEELDSFLLPEIPSDFGDYFVALDDEEICGEVDSLVPSDNALLVEETKEANELAEGAMDASIIKDDTPCEITGEDDLQSRSPVPSESLTILESPKGNTAKIDGINSTADAEEKSMDSNALDDDDGSDTDGDWTDEWFHEWFAVEEREPLTKNTIIHLMGVNGAFREATLKAISLTLGIKRGRKKILNKRMTVVLRDLRMRYRLAVTPELLYYVDHGIEAYPGPKTPLIDVYLALMCGGYLLRCLHRIDHFQDSRRSPSLNTQQIIQKMKNLLSIAARLSPAPLRNRVLLRTYVFHVRLEKYLALIQYFRKVTDAYNSVKTGQGPDAPIHLYNCPRLKNAVQEFALWDEFSMDNAIFPELPRPLIEASLIRAQLKEIIELEQIEKLKANEDLMIAVHISRGLFEKWSRRHRTWPDFYVVLG